MMQPRSTAAVTVASASGLPAHDRRALSSRFASAITRTPERFVTSAGYLMRHRRAIDSGFVLR